MDYGKCRDCERRFEHPNQYKMDPPWATADMPSVRVCRGRCQSVDLDKLEAWVSGVKDWAGIREPCTAPAEADRS